MTPDTTSPLRILAVDDHEDILEVVRLTLGRKYDVLTLSSPMEVYELIDLFEPDLLIMDVMMPRINGYQLLEILQRNPRTKGLPVIMFSAKSGPTEIKHGYKLGAALYLTKPIEPERLLKNVDMHFEQNPPASLKKTAPLNIVNAQLRLRPVYRNGHAKLSCED